MSCARKFLARTITTRRNRSSSLGGLGFGFGNKLTDLTVNGSAPYLEYRVESGQTKLPPHRQRPAIAQKGSKEKMACSRPGPGCFLGPRFSGVGFAGTRWSPRVPPWQAAALKVFQKNLSAWVAAKRHVNVRTMSDSPHELQERPYSTVPFATTLTGYHAGKTRYLGAKEITHDSSNSCFFGAICGCSDG
jgi:hypothetical protein